VTPESLEIQLARLDEQVKALRQVVEGARFIADNVHRNAERLAVHEERFNDMHSDIGALEGRMENAVSRVETSCNALGELIRQTSQAVTKVESEQRVQTETRSPDSTAPSKGAATLATRSTPSIAPARPRRPRSTRRPTRRTTHPTSPAPAPQQRPPAQATPRPPADVQAPAPVTVCVKPVGGVNCP
jgi:peptidoglycan hydrolase CwlO-like protein